MEALTIRTSGGHHLRDEAENRAKSARKTEGGKSASAVVRMLRGMRSPALIVGSFSPSNMRLKRIRLRRFLEGWNPLNQSTGMLRAAIGPEAQNRKDSTKPPTLKVSYTCKPEDEEGNLISEQVSEWVCFEHPEGNFAREKAEQWWELRSSEPVPDLVDDAVSLMDQGACRVPSKLTTLKEHGDFFTRILKTEFTDEIPEFDGVSTGFNFSFGDDDLPF